MPDDLKSELSASFTFSQSSLQDYDDCPCRFRLRYIEHLDWPAVEAEPVRKNERQMKEGQIFHRLVQQRLVGLPVEVLSQQATTPDLAHWWENYLRFSINVDDYRQYSELTLIAPCGTHALMSKFDLLAIKPGQKALIFDWKTTLKHPKNEWMAERMQTRVYRAMLVQAGAYLNSGIPIQPDQIEMVYWYSNFPSEPAHFPYDDVHYKRDLDALNSLISIIVKQHQFPMTDDVKKCVFCPYRSYCSRGISAGTLEEAELETEETINECNQNYEQIAEIGF